MVDSQKDAYDDNRIVRIYRIRAHYCSVPNLPNIILLNGASILIDNDQPNRPHKSIMRHLLLSPHINYPSCSCEQHTRDPNGKVAPTP